SRDAAREQSPRAPSLRLLGPGSPGPEDSRAHCRTTDAPARTYHGELRERPEVARGGRVAPMSRRPNDPRQPRQDQPRQPGSSPTPTSWPRWILWIGIVLVIAVL